MKLFLKHFYLVVFLFSGLNVIGQNSAQNDSILQYSSFISAVLKNHPLSTMAELQIDAAKANLLKAKGNFDPSISYNFFEKNYDQQRYYRISQAKLNLPTGVGPSLFLTYDYAQGDYVNPENKSSYEGFAGAGVSIPVLRGLIWDENRTELRQAKLIRNASTNQRKLIQNQLIVNATIQYWYWFESYNKLEVSLEGLQLAKIRLNGIIESAKAGDEPYIDTLEAHIQYQNRLVNYQKNWAEYQINQLQLGFFIWTDTNGIVTNHIPPRYELFAPPALPNFNKDSIKFKTDVHPELVDKSLKIGLLEADKKMAWEAFKPQADIIYKPLLSASNLSYHPENYNIGLNVKVPILYRKERGTLQKTNVSIQQTQLELIQKQKELFNKATGSYYELQALEKQIEWQKNNVKNTAELFNAEQQKLSVGESSVFMMNVRENAYLDAEIKLVELLSKYEISLIKYLYFANEL